MKTFDIKNFRYFSDTYIESGSCWGESINRALKARFNRIKSCELQESFYRHCLNRFKNKNVELYLGKSSDQLSKMLEDVYEPSVIFLDAHPAGTGTAGHEELMNGNPEFHQNTIISQELKIILEHRKDHLIIIDDQNGENHFKDQLPNYTFEFLDEQLTPTSIYYNSKILVCYPSKSA
jgi:hypothetical protein